MGNSWQETKHMDSLWAEQHYNRIVLAVVLQWVRRDMGKTTDGPITTHGKVTAFPPFSHEEMLREGTMPWESQLLFLAWCWHGCDPHPQVSGTSQTHGNNNIPLLLIQVAAGCRREATTFLSLGRKNPQTCGSGFDHSFCSSDPAGAPTCRSENTPAMFPGLCVS